MDIKNPPVSITTIIANTDEWTTIIEAVGHVRAKHSTEVTSQISGQVKEISFKSGQKINKGDVIVQLDDSLLQATLRKQIAKKKLGTNRIKSAKIKLYKTSSTAKKFC